ncbi:MAG TPA: NADH-quinone oxidoreductase subunit NuoE [Streptosporangiaceae bacterium]|nr:NADH-quinone oxidoreductase subunit NuoE [Streptosporangiaceae bacterium]
MPFSEEVRAKLDQAATEIIGRYPRSRSALLPLLHLVQAEEGYVSDDGIAYCAERLGLTETDVTATLSYYTMYKRQPVGDYHVGVCTNTLCAIMGGDKILASLRKHLGVRDNEPTPDGKVSVEHIECNAACDFAPVLMVNWEFFDNMTPDSARALVDDLRSGAAVTPPRGPRRLCTWREAEKVLAGFPDGLATEGPQAGEPTLVGLKIAKERGWTAPAAKSASAPKTSPRQAQGGQQ